MRAHMLFMAVVSILRRVKCVASSSCARLFGISAGSAGTLGAQNSSGIDGSVGWVARAQITPGRARCAKMTRCRLLRLVWVSVSLPSMGKRVQLTQSHSEQVESAFVLMLKMTMTAPSGDTSLTNSS